ncbi:hypothetical protein Goarm_022801, partial [Gossypium armourianum]|nr:hypothetical protein [Gossypium armourianum]
DFNLPSYDLDLTLFLGWLLDNKYHNIGIVVGDVISSWMVNVNLHLWLDHRTPKLEAQLVVYNSPTLAIQRREAFAMLDGSFRIKANRKRSLQSGFTSMGLTRFDFWFGEIVVFEIQINGEEGISMVFEIIFNGE